MTTNTDPDALWREFHERLLAFVRRRIDHEADAEDVLQDVFLRIQASSERASPPVQSVSGWIYQVTRNAITDYYRTRASAARARAALEQAATTAAEASPRSDQQARNELASCLGPLVAKLPELYSEAVSLTDLGELSQADAALQLGLSSSGMKSRVQRGRAKLEALVLECCSVQLDSRGAVTSFDRRKPADNAKINGDDDDDDDACC